MLNASFKNEFISKHLEYCGHAMSIKTVINISRLAPGIKKIKQIRSITDRLQR